MKESVGYTVTLNIIIMFLIIIFAFISAALIYFKSNKVGNIITDSIEKYEGYNALAESEISMKLSSVGYNVKKINCADTVKSSSESTCNLVKSTNAYGQFANCINNIKINISTVERVKMMLDCRNKYLSLSSSNDIVQYSEGKSGYCVYLCNEGDYYYYKIRTNMMLNIPIIDQILDIPIFSNTNRLYDFESELGSQS